MEEKDIKPKYIELEEFLIRAKNADLDGSTLLVEKIGDLGAKLIADALATGNVPRDQKILINKSTTMTEDGVKYLADALQSGPPGLTLQLSESAIGTAGVKYIAESLQSGKCPKDLTINLSRSVIGEGVEYIAEALKSGDCPPGLKIVFGPFSSMNDKRVNNILDAIKSGKCPLGLKIGFDLLYNISDSMLNTIAEVMRNNTTVVLDNTTLIERDVDSDSEVDSDAEKALKIIEHCSLRNDLLYRYPDFESIIMAGSKKAGIFSGTRMQNPPSLKTAVSLFLAAHKNIKTESLPSDLKDYLKAVEDLQQISFRDAPKP